MEAVTAKELAAKMQIAVNEFHDYEVLRNWIVQAIDKLEEQDEQIERQLEKIQEVDHIIQKLQEML